MNFFQFCTKQASHVVNHTFQNWEGNICKRDLRNDYVKQFMSLDNAAEVVETAQEIIMLNNALAPAAPAAPAPAPVKAATTAPKRRRVGVGTSRVLNEYRSMDRYNSIEDWQRAENAKKRKAIHTNGRKQTATINYTARHGR